MISIPIILILVHFVVGFTIRKGMFDKFGNYSDKKSFITILFWPVLLIIAIICTAYNENEKLTLFLYKHALTICLFYIIIISFLCTSMFLYSALYR